MTTRQETTCHLMRRVERGDVGAAAELMPHLYDELRVVAERHFRRQPEQQTLQPTALVHEVYMRLAAQAEPDWRTQSHFMAVAAKAMRQVLVDNHRKRAAEKRGAGWNRLTLSNFVFGRAETDVDIDALNEALEELAELDQQQFRLIELRFFAGMTVKGAAEVLRISLSTAERQWRFARAWLMHKLSPDSER